MSRDATRRRLSAAAAAVDTALTILAKHADVFAERAAALPAGEREAVEAALGPIFGQARQFLDGCAAHKARAAEALRRVS